MRVRVFLFMVNNNLIYLALIIKSYTNMMTRFYFNYFRIISCYTNISSNRQPTNCIYSFIADKREHFRTKTDSKFRSEEHTSELQSRFDLVCRLLLEKKKHRTAAEN